jgi:hypothetical protein
LATVENRKRTSTDASLTEVSPGKEGAKDAVSGPLLLEWKAPGVIDVVPDLGAQRKLDFDSEGAEKNYAQPSGTPPPPPSAREQKRPKKHTTPKKDKSVTAKVASTSEGRQSK